MTMTTSRGALMLCALLPLPALAAAPATPFAPLAFLAGHCWQGTFADGKTTDEHCFSWVYGGKFLRDQHTVRAPGRADTGGESIYFWNASARQLQYLYIESDGGFIRGTVTAEGNTLVFPASAYQDEDATETIRSRWQRSGQDAYDVATELQGKDGWGPLFALHMKRRGD
jgi:hypothetical protein